MENKSYLNILKTKYVDDKKITDHYAIIPTGQGLGALKGMQPTAVKVYEVICRRFLAIFYPPAVYQRVGITIIRNKEKLFSSNRILLEEGYLKVMQYSFFKKKEEEKAKEAGAKAILEATNGLRKGSSVLLKEVYIKEGETSPPKRYTTGSMILAMENAGNLIEDEELREEIKGSGIGTSATRADILEKLVAKDYLVQNKKTQVLTPSLQGEMIFYVVWFSIRQLLSPKLTAGWERGLSMVAQGELSEKDYMDKLEAFIRKHTGQVLSLNNKGALRQYFDYAAPYYKDTKTKKTSKRKTGKSETKPKRGNKSGKRKDQ